MTTCKLLGHRWNVVMGRRVCTRCGTTNRCKNCGHWFNPQKQSVHCYSEASR